VFVCSSFNLNAQHKYSKDSLQVLRIKNNELIQILEGVITHEMSCKYYKPNLKYSIHFNFFKDSLVVQIESIGFEIVKLGNELGCFVYRGHLFIVSGKYLVKRIFSITDRKKQVAYWAPTGDELPPSPCIVNKEGKKESVEFLSAWIYKYDGVKNTFIFRGFYSSP
jgi:hypothetical protein